LFKLLAFVVSPFAKKKSVCPQEREFRADRTYEKEE
jgi:hypothetical protein